MVFCSWLYPQRRVTYLADNDVEANNLYIVTVLTGMMQRASTKAKITIRLEGENGRGVKHVLADDYIKLFRVSAEDLFVVAESKDLGRIIHITLWVDYADTTPAW